jgi:hypothetical protein
MNNRITKQQVEEPNTSTNADTLSTPTQRELMEARSKVLRAIGERKIEPTPGLMMELATWNVLLGDVEVFSE